MRRTLTQGHFIILDGEGVLRDPMGWIRSFPKREDADDAVKFRLDLEQSLGGRVTHVYTIAQVLEVVDVRPTPQPRTTSAPSSP